MNKNDEKFLVDLGDEKQNKLISNIEFKLDNNTNQLLKIKEQLELIDSMNLTENQSNELKEKFVFFSLPYYNEVERVKMESILRILDFIHEEKIIDFSKYSTHEAVKHSFYSAIKIHGFLISVYHDNQEYLDKLERYYWVIQDNNPSFDIINYINDDSEPLDKGYTAALFRCHSNLLGLAHSFLFSKDFKTKFLKYTEVDEECLEKIDDILS